VSAGDKVRSLHDLAAAATESPGVVVRRLKRVEEVELKVLDVAVGGSTPFHSHPHAHEAVVLSGRGALRLRSGEEELVPGDVFSIDPGEPHAVANRGGEPLRFVCLDCFLD
jgi:quercetin dioxygenase-like cupin family protein